MTPTHHILAALLLMGTSLGLRAEIKPVMERTANDDATGRFRFTTVPAPSKKDAATGATFSLVSGQRDVNGGELSVLHDGVLPAGDDAPGQNFFFSTGTTSGRLQVDLGEAMGLRQINTYSWHTAARGPQVYVVYGSDGKSAGFEAKPKEAKPETVGWTRIAAVDTRQPKTELSGQYGVSIQESEKKNLGSYRYLLFEVARTSDTDPFANTFFSEIDVVNDKADPETPDTAAQEDGRKTLEIEGGKYKITFDTFETPDLTAWVEKELLPVVSLWYPKLVAALPSVGYEAPKKVTIVFFKDMKGVADASGSRIRCAAGWFRNNLQGEACGAVVHELVHVVQQYNRAGRRVPAANRPPGWLVEGIPDYIRFFKYEPTSVGADISARNLPRAKYDANYRISANFLNYVVSKYDTNLIQTLNAALREGRYEEGIWKERAGKTVQELGEEWKKNLEARLAPPAAKETPEQKTP